MPSVAVWFGLLFLPYLSWRHVFSFRSEDATDSFLTDSPSLSSFRPVVAAAGLRMAAAAGPPPSRVADWASPPPSRVEWSSPPPSRVEWSSPPPSRADWAAATRSEWSAPPTPRPAASSRLNWNNNSDRGGGASNLAAAAAAAAAAVRPENLPAAAERDKSTLKVHLPNGGFNIVKFGDATDIKVRIELWLLKVIELFSLGYYYIDCVPRFSSVNSFCA